MSMKTNTTAPQARMGLRSLAAAALVLAPLSFSCQDTAVASSNLDALLDTNNHLRHYAGVQSGWKYYLSTLIDPRVFGANSANWLKSEKQIDDPAYLALENLLVVAEGEGAREAHRHIIQVRQFSRFARRSPGSLVRERAILELAPHARRLQMRDLSEVLDAESNAGPFANAADLSTLLAGLIDTLEPVLQASSNPTDTQLSDFALACDQFEESKIEIDGLWRVLKAIETFAARVDLQRESLAPLLNLSNRLQRRAIAFALAGGATDASPRVRSAALQSSFEAFGHPVLQEALNLLRRDQPKDKQPLFGMVTASIVEDTVASRLFTLLADHGWPHVGLPNSLEYRRNRFEDMRSALTIVHNRAQFGSHTRLKTLQALRVLVPDGPQSLREEDWTGWWLEWTPTEQTELKRLSEQASGALQS